MSDSLTYAKVVLLGDSGVGKTSLISQYVSGSVPESPKPTIGAAFIAKEVNIDGHPLELRIWDTAGQEVYRGLAPMYYRSASVAIIVFDVTSNASFESVGYWIKELKTNVSGSIIILVCGNKIDLEDSRVIDQNTAQQYAEANGALYAETSAQIGNGVDRMFQSAVSKLIITKEGSNNNSNGLPLNNENKIKSSGGCC